MSPGRVATVKGNPVWLGQPAGVRIFMTAAHGGYDSERVPLGGGAAVCERLCRAWRDRAEVHLVAPGPTPPPGVHYHRLDLLDGRVPSGLGEFEYARFCRRFEQATTSLLEQYATGAVVFSHDISEGPDFGRLARLGIPCVSIFHVDVVDFFNRIYLANFLPVDRVARFFARLRPTPLMPDLLRLVFDKQADAVACCPRLVVPSEAMKAVLERCYPELPPDRTRVVPWGAPVEQAPGDVGLDLDEDAPVLLTLSRLSPEKGQDRLLQALAIGERRGEIPPGLTYLCCGGPAYMKGRSFEARLRRLASRLGQARVLFPGHLGGGRKRAAYERANLFVVPSRHESYGLTTMEALQAGTPVVAVRSYGTQATVMPAWGHLVEPGPCLSLRLWLMIRDMLEDDRLASMGANARKYAREHSFERAAERMLAMAVELTAC